MNGRLPQLPRVELAVHQRGKRSPAYRPTAVRRGLIDRAYGNCRLQGGPWLTIRNSGHQREPGAVRLHDEIPMTSTPVLPMCSIGWSCAFLSLAGGQMGCGFGS